MDSRTGVEHGERRPSYAVATEHQEAELKRCREHIKRNHLVVESPCSQCGHSSWKHNSAKKEPEAARANRKEGRGKRKRAVGTQKSHFSPPCTHPSHDYDRRDWISQTDADRIFSKMDTSIKPSTTTSLERQKWATFYMEINAGTNPDDVPSHCEYMSPTYLTRYDRDLIILTQG